MQLAQFDASTLTLRNVFALTVPEAVLLAGACLIYLGGTVRANRHLWAVAALAVLGFAFAQFWTRPVPMNLEYAVSPLRPDALAEVVKVIAYGAGALLLLLFWDEVDDSRAADFHASALLLVAGLSLVGAANDLITLFLALELISIPTYVLLYLPRAGATAQEAAVKYFLLSVFSSVVLLFGFSYFYGLGGETNLTALFQSLSVGGATAPGLAIIAFVTIMAGIGFRLTAVPFHFYAPDVFQGAPTSVAAMLAVVPKVAGFTALLRLVGLAYGPSASILPDVQVALMFWLLAAITMTVGNILGLLQNNLKRLLAYSSIAHGGYMLIGISAAMHLRGGGPRELLGSESVFFYLVAYAAMTLGAFAVLHALRGEQDNPQTVDDIAGLGRSRPLLALALTLFLFSLIGLPLTAGFAGKFLLFFSAIEAENQLVSQRGLFIVLVILGALNSAAAAFYYLRVVAAMYLRDGVRPPRPALRLPTLLTIGVCAALTIGMGIYPTPVVRKIRSAMSVATMPAAIPVALQR